MSSVNSKCCVRDRMVGSTLCGSVVASTNTTCGGGSSSVFSSVFDAAAESMCTSSTMYTLRAARCAEAEVHALDELAHRFDAVVRRRVELDEVVERSIGERETVLALAARLTVGPRSRQFSATGEQARRRGLAGAARTREEVRVTDAVFGDRVAHRGGDVVLADQFREALRTVLPVQAGHAPTLLAEFCDARVLRWLARGPGQATRRHPGVSAESCFLPDLTRFTGSRRARTRPAWASHLNTRGPGCYR